MQDTLASGTRYKMVYEDLPTRDVTFKGGLVDHIHQWFRLTPSFSPKLVHYMKQITDTGVGHKVLDPFSGANTTVIECMREGIDCVGVDINPVFVMVGQAEIDWSLDIHNLIERRDRLKTMFELNVPLVDKLSMQNFCEKYNVALPPIHKPEKWWREDVLKRLLLIKKFVGELDDEKERRFFNVGLLSKVVDVANVNRSHPTLTFCDRNNDFIDVSTEIFSKYEVMIHDLENAQKIKKPGKSQILEGDSTKISNLKLIFKKFDRVFTSPPYPNRYSYVWETRPQLYFGDIFDKASQAADLDIKTIGGTWGKATSNLAKGIIVPENEEVAKIVGSVCSEIRVKDNLMANYVMNYFNLLYLQIKSLGSVLNKDAQCCYVVGNSRIKDVEVYTDIILADLFISLGYSVPKIIRVRKRLGRKKLYESIVVARN